jgi:N-acetylmuramic acid 6-phosphate (MurNAc-6-P) etherase
MDLLQTIFSNNKLVLEAVERTEPVLLRLAAKVADRLHAGGRIICLGAVSPVPGEYQAGDKFCTQDADVDIAAGRNDIIIAVDYGNPEALAPQLRAWRRRGLLTACISCKTASAAASAAEIAIILQLETVGESRRLKEHAAMQVALDTLLTLALSEAGQTTAEAPGKKDNSLARAAASLMKECPALDMESAMELIQRHGSVKKAAKAYKENVQGKL